MCQLTEQYVRSGNVDYALVAMRLAKRIRQPYQVQIRLSGQLHNYFFSPFTSISYIEQPTKDLGNCRSLEQADNLVKAFRAIHFK